MLRFSLERQLSVESNLELLWFCFTTLYDWFKKFATPTQPFRCKTKTNRDLVARVFPALGASYVHLF